MVSFGHKTHFTDTTQSIQMKLQSEALRCGISTTGPSVIYSGVKGARRKTNKLAVDCVIAIRQAETKNGNNHFILPLQSFNKLAG